MASPLFPPTTTVAAPVSTTPLPKGSQSDLGKDAFLKLLVGQLQHQDPMSPTGDQEFIGQMAQFSTLEQMTNLAEANTRLANAMARDGAVSLIGRTVSYKDGDVNATGVVGAVSVDGDVTTLTIGARTGIDPTTVTEVR